MKASDVIDKKDLRIGIFGLGKSNLGVIDYLKRKNSSLLITVRSDKPIEYGLPPNVNRVFVKNDSLKDINEDVLFLSPSVRKDRPEIADAERRGVIISSDAELFFEKTKNKPIAVTGSDGKSTTTHLIAAAHTYSGIPATPCGNYGKSLSSLLDENVFPVVELSSFQLNCFKPRTSYAVITNITPNHLNWHTSLNEYISAKMNVTENAEKVVFDIDSAIASHRLSRKPVFARVSLNKSYAKLKAIGGGQNYLTYNNGIIYLNGSPFSDISRAKRREAYNLRNFLITAAVCFERCKEDAITEAIVSFPGLSHRAEIFFESKGIKYIDSSIDSSPERTVKTLSSLDDKPIAIIGGMSKGLSVDKLAAMLPSLTRGAVFLGEIGKMLASSVSSNNKDYQFQNAENMLDAVIKARELLGASGTIILSPAATSFDVYKNFSERGDDFKKIVLSLHK